MPALHHRIPGAVAGFDYYATAGRERFVVGVDLGTQIDNTAITVVHEQVRPLDTWGNDSRQLLSEPERAIVAAYRLRLGLDYSRIADHIAALRRSAALLGDPVFVIDLTGLGRPVGSLLRERGFGDWHGVTITSGNEPKPVSFGEWNVGKTYLIGSLSAAMSQRKLLAAADLPDGRELQRQLEDYQIEFTASGNITANAASGAHDDLVTSTALAWFGVQHVPSPQSPLEGVSW